MIATLPMYDWPEVRQATDAWWAGLAGHLRDQGFDAPDRLTRNRNPSTQWRRPDLIMSQTCGYPLVHAFKGKLEPLATPVYAAEGCTGPRYSSVIVVAADAGISRLEDLKGATAAFNAADSLSGHLALRCVIAPLNANGRFFSQLIRSGSHLGSMRLVHEGAADVAAIDCVAYALASRYRLDLVAGLKVIARGPAAPALPYVTTAGRSRDEVARLRRALAAAVADPELSGPRAALFIAGLEFLPPDAYHSIFDLEAGCDALGYARLA
jgi:ABC-type phosphate/phosphonate transport system substrate-binding protein